MRRIMWEFGTINPLESAVLGLVATDKGVLVPRTDNTTIKLHLPQQAQGPAGPSSFTRSNEYTATRFNIVGTKHILLWSLRLIAFVF